MERNDYILILEDDKFQQNILLTQARLLTDGEIICVESGFEALDVLKQKGEMPEFIVCDLQMPEMNGVDFIAKLSELDNEVPVVILSGVEGSIISSVLEMAKQFGMVNVATLSKPATPKKFEEVLSRLKDAVCSAPTSISYDEMSLDFERAFAENELVVYFQPQISVESGKVIGLEALTRWSHPQYGLLTPNQFLSELIEKDYGYALFKKVLDSAIEVGSFCHKQKQFISISVNVAPNDLLEDDFYDHLIAVVSKHNFPPHKLILELTENDICDEVASLLRIINKIRILGIELSIDDFGTGHSSLWQLVHGPFTELKIDKNFIDNMLESSKHMAAVNSTIALALSLELKVVAEGVETEGQYFRLKQLGCEIVQGYYFSKPLSQADLMEYMATVEGAY